MSKRVGTLLIAGLLVACANAQPPCFRVFFDTEGSDGELGSHRPGDHVLSYGNPELPAGGGRLYIYGEFHKDEQNFFCPTYDIAVDGGVITDAWNYNEPGQDTLTGDFRWDAASPDPNMASGTFTACNLQHMGLKNGLFADHFDLQHDNTNGFGDTLLGYIDVANDPGVRATVWITVGQQGFGNFGHCDDIAFGYGDAPVRAGVPGVRTQIPDATVGAPCDPCDMNCDGEINAFDIGPFLDLLFEPNPDPCDTCTGDTNGDRRIDAFDIEPFLECLFP